MKRLGVVRLTGKSGNQYPFSTYPLGTVFEAGMGGVYVVTKRVRRKSNGAIKHREVFIGQTGDLHMPLGGEAQAPASAGANCICVYAENDDTVRQGIHQDLMGRHRPDDTAD